MPRITFIKNDDGEIIYPKTHEDAILTNDGISLNDKYVSIKKSLDNKSDSDHKHYFKDLLEVPESFTANGGNADTVNNASLNDSKTGSSYLWSSTRITKAIDDSAKTITDSIDGLLKLKISNTEPEDADVWIDTVHNTLKYKVDGNWVQLTFNVNFVESTDE